MFNIAEIGPISFTIEESDEIVFRVDAAFPSGHDTEPYQGAYTVKALFEEQTLQTKNKRMTDNLTVRPIRVSVTTNQAGGNTVYIGEE